MKAEEMVERRKRRHAMLDRIDEDASSFAAALIVADQGISPTRVAKRAYEYAEALYEARHTLREKSRADWRKDDDRERAALRGVA
jgi:hypothetical protein